MVIASLRTASQQRPSFPAFRSEAPAQEWSASPAEQFIPSSFAAPTSSSRAAAPAVPASPGQKFSAVLAEVQKSAEVSPWADVQDWNIAKLF